jgi:hypothetical protein
MIKRDPRLIPVATFDSADSLGDPLGRLARERNALGARRL